MQSQVRFNRVPEKVPEKFLGSLGAKPNHVQRVPEKVAEKVPEKGLGIFCAGPDQFNTVLEKVPEKVWEALAQSRRRCGRLWCGARLGSTRFRRRFRRRFREALVQSQVRFNRVPENVPEKVGSLGAQPSQVQRVWEKVAEKVPEKVLGIFGAGPGQVPTGSKGFQRLVSRHASERFARIKRCGCWGYDRSLCFLSNGKLAFPCFLSLNFT